MQCFEVTMLVIVWCHGGGTVVELRWNCGGTVAELWWNAVAVPLW